MVRKQKGVSLIETLIALSVGLLVLSLLSVLFIGQTSLFRGQDARDVLQQDASFAMSTLVRSLRFARRAYTGMGSMRLERLQLPYLFVGASSDFSLSGGTLEAVAAGDYRRVGCLSVDGVEITTGTAQDCVVIGYAGSGSTALADFGAADGSVVDCRGQAIGAYTVAINQFYVANGKLRCRVWYRHVAPVYAAAIRVSLAAEFPEDAVVDTVITSGVEGFRLLFGADITEPVDRYPERYASADTVDLDFRQVFSMKISLLMASQTRNLEKKASATLWHFGRSLAESLGEPEYVYTVPQDGRYREMFETSVVFRNIVVRSDG